MVDPVAIDRRPELSEFHVTSLIPTTPTPKPNRVHINKVTAGRSVNQTAHKTMSKKALPNSLRLPCVCPESNREPIE